MAEERAVSSVLGVVLILGITLTAITTMMVLGTYALTESQGDAQLSQMETAMAQMSSKASLSALGEADEERFDLGGTNEGFVEIDPDAGNLTVEAVNEETGDTTTLYSTESFGAMIYHQGDERVAYQGGGVWRLSGDDVGSMISPPEYHYREETLTFPIIVVSGDDRSDGFGRGTIEHQTFDSIFPDASMGNPVEDLNVTVEVQSEYHRGWFEFFESRTTGEVEHDPDNQTVKMELTVPFQEAFETAVAASSDSDVHHQSEVESVDEGTNFPSASSDIDDKIDDCESAGHPEFNSSQTTYDGGETYCANESLSFDEELEFDTTDGNITVVLPEGLDMKGSNGISINGTNNVKIYSKESIGPGNGDINADGEPRQLFIYLHSSVDHFDDDNNNFEMRGVIYAPNTDVTFDGNIDYTGAIIADSFDANSATIDVNFDSDLENVDPGIEGEGDVIRFLHITENVIEISLD